MVTVLRDSSCFGAVCVLSTVVGVWYVLAHMAPKLELIAPAGNRECARAAVANGADAVYFGLPRFNARMRADNFSEGELPGLVQFLHDHGVRAFCTFNTLIFTGELADAEKQLVTLDRAGVDVIIVQDLGLARLARELGVRMDVHASTQMSITSPEGVQFAGRLGVKRVVLARELSMRELAKFQAADSLCAFEGPGDRSPLPSLEVFVHGALCVAYSGQCLTSEAMGQRSANRGECAQACRLPYELIVDGVQKEMGDRRYLLSPQDLAAVREIPELIRLGITGFKIEGRLKTPEYVAAVTQVYRKAIDAALATHESRTTDHDHYQLEMVFSRGLYPGWLHGVNHQELVHARFGKKRGPFVGAVKRVGHDHVEVEFSEQTLAHPLRSGDGLVFDTGGDTDKEQGGALYAIYGNRLHFGRGRIDFSKIKRGDRVWKTSDPQLTRELRKSFERDLSPPKVALSFRVSGAVGEPLRIEANGVWAESTMALQAAKNRPLITETLRAQLGRLGDTSFVLDTVRNELEGDVILPVSELNRLRREIVERLGAEAVDPGGAQRRPGTGATTTAPALSRQLSHIRSLRATAPPVRRSELVVLCRTMEQIGVALAERCETIYVDFEDIRRSRDAVALVRSQQPTTNHQSPSSIFLATPRIQKAGEQGFFKLIESCQPDGILIRNPGALDYFSRSTLRRIGDFSLNVANPLTAELLIAEGLERLTISYDLNAQQVFDLLRAAPPLWFELTIHQHMPMFHMEHCVFAAFLSTGTDHTNCGRPCDRHNLKLRDRVGMEHPVKADVGCRNTVFHSRAQSGADYLREFMKSGLRTFRVELLEENATQTRRILTAYRELLDGSMQESTELFRRLNVVKQLGVTSGTLTVLS